MRPGILAALALLIPLQAGAQASGQGVEAGTVQQAVPVTLPAFQDDLARFYAERNSRPMWFTAEGSLAPAGQLLLKLVRTAEYDGVAPGDIGGADKIDSFLKTAGDRGPEELLSADRELSAIFVSYVKAVAQAPRVQPLYESNALRPSLPDDSAILEAAAAAPSLDGYLESMGWMHPLYAPLRLSALVEGGNESVPRDVLIHNLLRLRAIPAMPGRRHILIDIASARLWMFEGTQPVDSMKVVVGRPDQQTPMMAGLIREAIVNPYWNIPSDLVRKNIASKVMSMGPGYIKAGRYQILSDWGQSPKVLDPAKIDWGSVANGSVRLRVRQRPGHGNAMGAVKYEFPNELGIYLHDTPEKGLMDKLVRQLSSGCIRLEDASRLGRWMLGRRLPGPTDASLETRVTLPEPMPIYITYLTAHSKGSEVAAGPDPYQRDSVQAYALGNPDAAARSLR